ncbi:MAG: glycosyltransferase family 4 protein [Candidatus Eisenbacteria bacterium]|nr:glycosyltransferase family 4 protein [Candidatus Eisenbacteria bacterium]
MKVGIVTPTYYPYPGGVTEHVYHLRLGLEALGHDVRVVTTCFGKGDGHRDGAVLRIGRSVAVPANGSLCPVAMDLRMSARVREVLARERFDILHLHEPFMPALCLSVLREAEAPVVGTFHASNESPVAYRVFRSLLAPSADKLAARIAVSDAARRTVEPHFPGRYRVIPNGVDVERFASATPLPELRDGRFNVLFVGRFEPRKGLKFLFRALPDIAAAVPDVRVVVVGGGPLAAYYKGFVPPSCRHAVHFAGFVSRDSLARHFASADVFCSPAVGGESFGIVLLEAMAAGAPIVASDIAGYRAVIRDRETGLLVRRGAADEIAAAVVALARDQRLRRRMAERARRAVDRYSWDRVAREIADVYEEVLAGDRPAKPALEEPRGAARGGTAV